MDSRQVLPALLALALTAGPASAQARVYTNDDLTRISPTRGETGGDNTPVRDTGPKPSDRRVARDRGPARGEEWWRAEAARVRERVRRVRDEADLLVADIEAARTASAPSSRSRGSSSQASAAARVKKLEARLAILQRRIGEMEGDLRDRAHRAGALPGWLR